MRRLLCFTPSDLTEAAVCVMSRFKFRALVTLVLMTLEDVGPLDNPSGRKQWIVLSRA